MDKTQNIYKIKSFNSTSVDATLIFVASLLLAISSFVIKDNRQFGLFLYLLSISIAACKYAISSIEMLLEKKLSPNLLITAAVLMLYISQKYDDAALIAIVYGMMFLLIETTNSTLSKQYMKSQGFGLKSFVIINDEKIEKNINEIKPGDVVEIEKGEFIFADLQYTDENGKKINISAGEINKQDAIKATVKKVYDCQVNFNKVSLYDKNSKTFGTFKKLLLSYTFVMIMVAILWFILNENFTLNRVLTFLATLFLIAVPYALKLGIKEFLIFNLLKLKSNGLDVKGLVMLEKLADIKYVVLNKAGVMTKGDYQVGDIFAADGYTQQDVITIAANVQSCVDNSVSRAILSYYEGQPEYFNNLIFVEGRGISGDFNGSKVLCGSFKFMSENNIAAEEFENASVYVAIDNKVIGAIRLLDTLKGDSILAVNQLTNSAVKPLIVSGDCQSTVKKITEKCGIENGYALLDAKEKAQLVATLNKNNATAYVGDEPDCLSNAFFPVDITDEETPFNKLRDGKLSVFSKSFDIAVKQLNLIKLRLILVFILNLALCAVLLFSKISPWVVGVIQTAIVILFLQINLKFTTNKSTPSN